MITGSVNASREAILTLDICDSREQAQPITAIVDTGFNGSLTLSLDQIETLGLTWRSRGRAVLADGSEQLFDIYSANVIWQGAARHVLVHSVETSPLAGMSLFYGCELKIQVIDGGRVTLDELH